MQAAAPRIRLFVETGLRAGAAVELTGGQAHYLQHVMRLATGDEVLLFNGNDGEWRARIEVLKKGAATASALAETRAQADGPDLWLIFAPIKRAPIDFLAQKATELGVSALAPVMTKRTMVKRINTDRLRANAIEAAEQSGRLDVPEVREPVTLERLLADWPDGRRLMLCDESGAGAPIAEALGKHGRQREPWAVLVGPEGGF
ncbi:MAG: 16S rRNA (uracil(1498)-N(3))-methyltransferase, partial [Alphaproteobacteria bacterium]